VPCFYCGVRLRPKGPYMRTKDHVVPKSRGGTKTVEACLKCNADKKDMSLEEFRRKRGGIEFWGEMKHRLEAEKTAWIYEFNADKESITPAPSQPSMFSSVEAILRTTSKPSSPKNLPQGTPNLRGVRFGALTVISWVGKRTTSASAKPSWMVKCICGAVEYRTTRAIRNPQNSFDACVKCRRPVGKLRSDIFKETGVEVTWDDCFQHIYGDFINALTTNMSDLPS